MSFFAVEPAGPSLALDPATRRGTLVFRVQNKSGHPRDLRAIVLPDEAEQASWYRPVEPVRPARVDETVEFNIEASPPAGAEPGTYGFRLRVVAEDDPDDVFSESDRVRVEVPEPAGPGVPWWVWAAGGTAAVAVVAVLAFLFLGGDDSDGPPVVVTPPGGGGTATPAPETATPPAEETEAPPGEETEVAGGGPVEDPAGPDLFFDPIAPECETIIGGALSGADVLNIVVRLGDPGPSPGRLVPVRATSDTGLSATASHAVSSSDALNVIQLDVAPEHYNRTHIVTIEADPDNEIVESDESNNTTTVTVRLGARSTGAQPCS